MNETQVLQANHVNKSFHDPVTVKILDDITLSVKQGEFVSIIGKSGCGKSTLLYILSTMDTDYEGDLMIGGELMRGKSDRQLARVRNEKIGFVFQFHYLLNEFTALENVMLPGLKLGKYPESEVRQRALGHLRNLDVLKLADKNANQLSGGEKQRVAIARALINDPTIIMGDEPTGNLDKKNSLVVFEIFRKLAEEHQQTILVVTHDDEFAKKTHRIIEMVDGRIVTKTDS
ncbi:MAG: ABC transporter ATP-binding protein [Bacteroidales bacterium]